MKPDHNTLLRALVGAGALAAATGALALPGDIIEFFVAETVTADSNVFRISRDRDAASFLGSSEKSDTRSTTSAGITLDAPISRQRIQGALSLNHDHYSRFSDLDFTGRDGRIVWLWQAGDAFNGQLGYRDTEAQASFLNFQGRTPNVLSSRRAFVTGAWRITPSWELQAGASQQLLRNNNALRQENDIDIRVPEIGIHYVTASENRIGLSLRQENGSYKQLQSVAGSLIDNAYRQRSIGLVGDWTVTGKSRLTARADHVQRNYDQLGQRDFNGNTVRVVYDWQATEKSGLSLVVQRDISPGEDVQTSFVLVKGIALRPSWELTEKTRLSGNLEYSIRDYLGDAQRALGVAGSDPARSDIVRAASVAISWQPLLSLNVALSGGRETRSSNVALGDYSANIVSLTARLAF
jgi:exopolysaccharide biosynthesis operon protein EpsL